MTIAVVGAGCRFPDAWTPQQFWSNIDDGVVSMRELSDEQLRAGGVPEARLSAADYVRIGTTLPGVADFAAEFFEFTPRDARLMDPQQRIFLEVAWEALEAAGHPPAPDGPLIGVFAGSGAGNYSAALMALAVARLGLVEAVDDIDLTIGGAPDFLTSRTAYKLGLRGPAVSLQAACSSSLYAVHYASLSLLSGECDIALAGGASVMEPIRGYRYRVDGGQSEDGYNRSFDERGTGTTFSSGVGVVALRRLSDALADGDPILAVLRGTAVGNDGAHKAGYAAPSPAGVADVVGAALRVADVPPELLRYAEAHGTATPLGDHVELSALTAALRTGTSEIGYCGLGSVKANIGHTGEASGIAGLLKAVHIARSGLLPPHPTYERPRDPDILAKSPFTIATSGRLCADADRHVLVNSIGFGGANAAAVLAPPPAPTRPAAPARDQIRLVLSARNRVELDELSRRLADVIDAGESPIADVEYTLRAGRHGFAERRVVSASPQQLAAALRLPRAPLAKTVRSTPRRAVVEVPDGVSVPPELVADVRAAIRTAEVTGDVHRIVIDGTADAGTLLAEAWLNGVSVDWEALARGRGRRIVLPTYPFTRKRYWALDGVSLADLTGERTSGGGPALQETSGVAADSIEAAVLDIWRRLFGDDTIGPDSEFEACGGTSLLSVQVVLEIQDRFGVVVNMHRAGGGKATVRRLAATVRGLVADPEETGPAADRMDLDDNGLVDADLQLPLGPLAAVPARGSGVLLTGATGYLGAFLLDELIRTTTRPVYCLVRAEDEHEARGRLAAVAAGFLLPPPDPDRVRVVPGDLRDIAKLARTYRDGEIEREVGHVLHCAAKVVFTEPYRVLRADNVLPTAELLAWSRSCGIRDFSFVSTAAATAPTPGADKILETRDQPLDARLGGYGVSKWVCERLLDRADEDGMRIRVFRPGLIMANRRTGACNPKDLVYFVLASGVSVGAHPVDNRYHEVAPVDVVAQAIVGLALARGSVGRAYHLVGEAQPGLRDMFVMLEKAGLPTRPVSVAQWQELVREKALATGNPILSAAALIELEGNEEGEPVLQSTGWQPWLRRNGIDPGVDGTMIRRALTYLARHDERFGAILPELAGER
ncbi:MAG: thioester reductase domain-containing protein [Catenulispora sp.]